MFRSPYSAGRSVVPVYYRKHLKWAVRKQSVNNHIPSSAHIPSRYYSLQRIGYTSLSSLTIKSQWTTLWKEKQMTHIYMSLPGGLGSSPGAQTDHPHTRSFDKRNSGRFALLFRKLKQSEFSVTMIRPGEFQINSGGGGGGSYHDPTQRVHTRCSLHQSEDTRRHECSNISCRGTPRLHRSHILPPCGQEET